MVVHGFNLGPVGCITLPTCCRDNYYSTVFSGVLGVYLIGVTTPTMPASNTVCFGLFGIDSTSGALAKRLMFLVLPL